MTTTINRTYQGWQTGTLLHGHHYFINFTSLCRRYQLNGNPMFVDRLPPGALACTQCQRFLNDDN